MGADQSNLPHGVLVSQRDEDIPYTSCSISKPISSGESKISSRLPSSQQKSSDALPRNDIVVVTDGLPQVPQVDTDEQRLNAIPTFSPLLSGILMQSPTINQLTLLDMRQVLALCVRYQDHLHQCADAVAFDQSTLSARVKEVDFVMQTLYAALTAQQKHFARCTEQIQRITEISGLASRIQMNLDMTIPIMERLNNILPVEDQLEPISSKLL